MVKNRHTAARPIPTISFTAPAGTPAGVEVLSLAELRHRVPTAQLAVPQRPEFHHLLTLTAGTLRHTVDFTTHTLEPGSWLWIRPGQVNQWGELTRAEGTLILFQQSFLTPATVATARIDDTHAPVLHQPLASDADALRLATDHLIAEFHAFGHLPLDVHIAALRHLLSVLVLRLAHLTAPADQPASNPDPTYLRFRDAVEHNFTHTRRVQDYATTLGYSARTLSRATLAAAGIGAKEFIDRRLILEAKRLLAHSDQTAARIADHLGFASATHFSKYFHQRTDQTPIAFRETIRGHTGQ
ncbi:helix-turn-helix domain-containing protein [Nocardia sp. NPDC050175]|uniref:helix-turn-helix transcriptional regulator n=1 Tax=Nocardia sp. NPDC050175 TaxID=3364317 RepID=UPI0037B84547